MKTAELDEYRQLASTAELHKSINMLRGMLKGIAASGFVSEAEATEFAHWCSLHAALRNRHPFSELLPVVEEALQDGKIDEEEKQDILWLCERVTGECDFYDDVTSSIQYLHGLIHGVLADGILTDQEIHELRDWLEENDFLKGTYPFEELYSLVCAVLADGIIADEERELLAAFMSEQIEFKDSYNLNAADYAALRSKYSLQGICSVCPDIVFSGKTFVVTGESYRATRREIVSLIEAHGGKCRSTVTKNTDYLIVGNAGNPCWAFACYGRKIEEAIALRKAGVLVQIVNETDFWDVLA